MNNTIWNGKYFKMIYPGKPRTWSWFKTTPKTCWQLSMHDHLNSRSVTNMLDINIIMGMTIKSQCLSRKILKKIKNSRIKCIQDYIKWNRKGQNNVLHLNNIRKKNTLPINKAKGDLLWMCIIIMANYIIIIIIRVNSRFYSSNHEGLLEHSGDLLMARCLNIRHTESITIPLLGSRCIDLGWDIHSCLVCRIYRFYQLIVGSIARDNQILHLAPPYR